MKTIVKHVVAVVKHVKMPVNNDVVMGLNNGAPRLIMSADEVKQVIEYAEVGKGRLVIMLDEGVFEVSNYADYDVPTAGTTFLLTQGSER